MRYVLLMIIPLLISGCITDPTINYYHNVSYGQEIIDLDAAYDSGLITEEEYNQLKSHIINELK
ncbi:hypothetical protein ATY35_18230 [Vibrio cidicii]|uniref:SHOCT domain-containing protein n=2 Tax=Vibrio cidicii TaxID=1763883 RepID=A0ABR5VZ44_9VIBR|nr:SHOCT domain-containing protein [Vibrio navarrensis]EJL6568256.1 SHOCT domain-containing protein [Vibrio navarrensis]KYN84381.1 hypothetical protein ATY35_18230 [Vibrio cidicii]